MSSLLDPPWASSAQEVLDKYTTDRQYGLDQHQIKELQRSFGKNILHEEKKQSTFTIFIRQFQNPMVYILLVAALVAAFLGEFLDAIAIVAILFLNVIFGHIQESKASSAMEELKKISVPRAKVIRDGISQTIPSEEVVPGDVILIEAGDLISADARIFEAFQLSVEEAALTGESVPVFKDTKTLGPDLIMAERSNMVHSGTAVNSGTGKAVVTATGMSTEIGHIAGLLEKTTVEETPLQIRLMSVTKKLIYVGLLVVVVVSILRYLEGDSRVQIFMSAIGLAVAAIPEGLPTVITLALAIAVRRMGHRHAIVRNLASVETLGSTDVICTDKTGTLTTGMMTVREIYIPENSERQSFIEAMVLCNNASIFKGGSGDSTERALLEFAETEGVSIAETNSRFKRIHEWSFDSARKRMSVAVSTEKGQKILVKGAPESMLDRCKLDTVSRQTIEEKVHKLTSEGSRLLAVGEKEGTILDDAEAVENDLIFLGLVALSDPPRPETKDSIRKCKNAGIKVVMITGDHPNTALAIAGELGIVEKSKSNIVLTGKDIESQSVPELRQKVEDTLVYARVSPSHKLKIVEALQENGHIVAMTGDGVNDAPALKKAQIGVSMGKGGTEVARQASRIILTDDNFSTIVSAVEEGRAIYGNIKRTIQYLFSTNLSEILIVLGASILALPVPFTPIGLLWINLVTDGLPSLALAAEPLDKNILKTSRRPSPATFFDSFFLKQIFIVGLIMTVLCLGIYKYQLDHGTEIRARSMTFALLIFMSLSISFACRSETRIFFKLPFNIYHLVSVSLPVILHLIMQETKILQEVFKIVPLSFGEILFLSLLCLIPPTVIEVNKLRIKHKLKSIKDMR